MSAIDINKKIVDGYFDLLRNLSPESKLYLIKELSDPSVAAELNKSGSLKSLPGDFIPEKSANEIIRDLRK